MSIEFKGLHEGELRRACDVFRTHEVHFHGRGYTGENSTSLEDCLMLYSLIRHFDRRSVFEVGTNIGTSAVVMSAAVQQNGGNCITCDPIDYGCLLPDYCVRFMHMESAAALAQLKKEGRRVDFAFFDWIPDEITLRLANSVFSADAILAVHDYAINPKGEAAVASIRRYYHRRGNWYLPKSTKVDGMDVNMCTAYFVPKPRLFDRLFSGFARHPTIQATL